MYKRQGLYFFETPLAFEPLDRFVYQMCIRDSDKDIRTVFGEIARGRSGLLDVRDDFDGIHRSVARHRLVAFKRDRNVAFFGLRTESVVVVDRTVRKDEYVARLPGYRGKILVGAVQPDIQALSLIHI